MWVDCVVYAQAELTRLRFEHEDDDRKRAESIRHRETLAEQVA